jgi:hypothetical protein
MVKQMNKYNRTLLAIIGASSVLLAGCSEDGFEAYESTDASSVTSNPGVISQKNFSLLADEPQPTVIDPTDGSFTQTDVVLTIFVGDRNNETITNPHTVRFVSEYGLINPPSCDTDSSGTCSVTWSAIKRPDPGGPGSDLYVTITAYATGEETFLDTNGNGIFDDGDAGFEDLEEPFVDADSDSIFTPGDTIIDVISTNDPTGANGVHDLGDGFFNGAGCTHSSLCAALPSIMVWDDIILKIDGAAAP